MLSGCIILYSLNDNEAINNCYKLLGASTIIATILAYAIGSL